MPRLRLQRLDGSLWFADTDQETSDIAVVRLAERCFVYNYKDNIFHEQRVLSVGSITKYEQGKAKPLELAQ